MDNNNDQAENSVSQIPVQQAQPSNAQTILGSQSNNTIPPVITSNNPVKSNNIFDFKSFTWIEWLSVLPAFILIIQGGAVGAIFGVLGWSLILKVTKKADMSKFTKVIYSLGITLAYYINYFILISAITSLIIIPK